MRVKVTAPPFCDHSSLDDYGWMELADEVRLSELLKKLKIPLILRPVLIIQLNYDKAVGSMTLKDGDIVNIYWPVSGG